MTARTKYRNPLRPIFLDFNTFGPTKNESEDEMHDSGIASYKFLLVFPRHAQGDKKL